MTSVLRNEELETFRQALLGLRARLRGDLTQMTDEALRRDQPDSSGNLSNVPLHMADVGSENYDQEFTLGLIENEQGTLEEVNEALVRIDAGTFGRCQECDDPIPRPRLQALPYTRHCIQCARAGWRVADERFGSLASVGPVLDARAGWGGVRPGDQAGYLRPGRPAGVAPLSLIAGVLELHTSYNRGALWGLGRSLPNSSFVFAALSVLAALAICYWLFVRGAAADGRLTAALALIMAGALGNCYDRLMLGHVRDFVHFQVDPIGFDCAIFNFADNMLVAGALALMLLALRPEPQGPETDARPISAESVHSVSRMGDR